MASLARERFAASEAQSETSSALSIYAAVLMPALIGVVSGLIDRDRQFLHDRLAGSLLVPVQ